ncbi:MAG TPA: hypothetical protein VEI96_10755 [Thermodesulfovibrionales bacterium]|nr:hypothetical protein [Thermodesulfovibrionales bacterium]
MAKRYLTARAEDLEYLEEEELDRIMSFLVYTLMEKTSLDEEEIYAFIYGDGKKILWN